MELKGEVIEIFMCVCVYKWVAVVSEERGSINYNHIGFCNGTIFVEASMIFHKSKVHIRRKYLKVIILCNN